MPLYGERKRLEHIKEREAAGENLWTTEVDPRARQRIAFLFRNLSSSTDQAIGERLQSETGQPLRGWETVSSGLGGADSTGRFFDILEAAYAVLNSKEWDVLNSIKWDDRSLLGGFQDQVNAILRSYRVSYSMVGGEFVPFTSDELHQAVVLPTLHLLVTDQYAEAHASYLKALKEIQNGDAPDAITDAGTALEHMLKALGCGGNSLGARWASAKKNHLVDGHDDKLHESINKAMEWASAQRSNRGDAHTGAAETNIDDAWLTVHIVGALIVRLSHATPSHE